MEAEAVRDAVLAASGKLDRTMGGPGFALFQYNVVNVAIYEPREEQGPETWRRSVYQIPARGIRDDLLGNFDCPDLSERAAQRDKHHHSPAGPDPAQQPLPDAAGRGFRCSHHPRSRKRAGNAGANRVPTRFRARARMLPEQTAAAP